MYVYVYVCVMAAYNSFVKRLSKTKRFKRGKKIIKVFWNCAFVMVIPKTIFLDVKSLIMAWWKHGLLKFEFDDILSV